MKSNKNLEYFNYIIDFITDSKYYEQFLKGVGNVSNRKDQSTTVNSNEKSVNISFSSSINNETFSDDIDNYYSITKILGILQKNENENKSKENQLLGSSFIREMKDGQIYIGGLNNMISIYNKDYNLEKCFKAIDNKNKDNEKKDIIKNIIETNDYSADKDLSRILICSKNAISLYNILKKEKQEIDIGSSKQYFIPCTGCFEIKNKKKTEYIIIGEEGIQHHDGFPSDVKILQTVVFKDSKIPYKGGININNKYLFLTSNSIVTNGRDLLMIYDIKKRKMINLKNKINFSFNIGVNGLSLITFEYGKEKKELILCACKKYISFQENGILIIDPEIKEGEIYYKLYKTEEFEVNCFCPLFKREEERKVNTNLFLVGGFDNEQRTGKIKLFRIEKIDAPSNKIKYDLVFLQDIIFEDDYEFNGSISCILQSKINGNLLVNCLDGNTYYLSEPNLNYYLKEEI